MKSDAAIIAEIWGEKRLAELLSLVRDQAEQCQARAKSREAQGKSKGGASIIVELVDHEGRLAEVWVSRRERLA